MIEVSNVFGGGFDKKKYFDLVSCLNGVQKLQGILSNPDAQYMDTLVKLNQGVCSFVSARGCAILLFDGKDLVTVCSTYEKANGEKRKVDDESPYAKVYSNVSPTMLKSKIGDAEYRELIKKKPGIGRSTMLIPLTTFSNECFGIIVVTDKKVNDKLDFFDQGDLNQMSIAANMISPTLFWYTREGETKKTAEMTEEMLHAVIHDLKSPVFCLKKTLEEQENLPERVLQDLDLLYNRVVNSLDISRVQEGKVVINKSFIKVKSILEEVVDNLTMYSDSYKVSIEMENIDEDEGFDGDSDFMLRVFENLFTNAIKHSGEEDGGLGSITIKLVSRGAEIVVAICDTGSGIPDNFKTLMFEKFTQLKSVAGSSGIGLSFCKLIVEAHGGRIEVEDNKPQGSIFKVCIPFASEEDEEEQAKKPKKVSLAPPVL